VRALGFCVGIEHARFMARFFQQAGIAAECLTSETDSDTRRKFRADLANGRLNILFVVDVFNEGVDIPEINCVLFLRPTESHIVYLQQLGRGLRRTSEEKCLTVLDFVGQCRREFRYDLRFSSLLPGKRHRLLDEVDNGFPHLPSGCAIAMERQAREVNHEFARFAGSARNPRTSRHLFQYGDQCDVRQQCLRRWRFAWRGSGSL